MASYRTTHSREPSRTAGFSLIEILVVVAVIALLVGILVPSIGYIRQRAQRAGDLAAIQSIEIGLANYKNDHNRLPASFFGDATDGDPDNNLQVDGANWYGAECLVQALVGYRQDAGGNSLDGKDGPGFRLIARGKVYGPYVDIDRMHMSSNPRPVFLDSFDQPILYYRYDSAYNSNAGGFVPGHNQGLADPDLNTKYATKGTGDFIRRDFLLCTPGLDGDWKLPDDGNKSDDINNLGGE